MPKLHPALRVPLHLIGTRSSRGRERQELTFDPAHPVAADTRLRLELINTVNSRFSITFRPENPWKHDFIGIRRLRPIHYARFTDNFDLHGRLYTRRYGHQSLSEAERQTIEFDGEPCVELDYGGMHPRMLYHQCGLDCQGDPYSLWGEKTTDAQRLLAKRLVNAAINARTPSKAIAACNYRVRLMTDTGKRKRGKKLERALQLRDALQETGLSFKQVHALAETFHRPIASLFGRDMGIQLMRIDSAIALDVLHHFAVKGIPALGCHDSFIVPRSYREELRQVMDEFYQRRLGFPPVIKSVEE